MLIGAHQYSLSHNEYAVDVLTVKYVVTHNTCLPSNLVKITMARSYESVLRPILLSTCTYSRRAAFGAVFSRKL